MLKKRGGGEELPSESVTKKQKTKKTLIPCPSLPWSSFPEKEISADLLDASEQDRPLHQ